MTHELMAALFGAYVAINPAAQAAGFLTSSASGFAGPDMHLQTVQYDQSDWHPIGCVRTPHECEHLAHSQGHHHHRVIHDHGCQYEPHLLCIAAG